MPSSENKMPRMTKQRARCEHVQAAKRVVCSQGNRLVATEDRVTRMRPISIGCSSMEELAAAWATTLRWGAPGTGLAASRVGACTDGRLCTLFDAGDCN